MKIWGRTRRASTSSWAAVVLVEGITGTGKSNFCGSLLGPLRQRDRRCAVVSKMHVAASRIHGVTVDVWVQTHNSRGDTGCGGA